MRRGEAHYIKKMLKAQHPPTKAEEHCACASKTLYRPKADRRAHKQVPYSKRYKNGNAQIRLTHLVHVSVNHTNVAFLLTTFTRIQIP